MANSTVNIGKIPGDIHEVQIDKTTKISTLFAGIGIKDLSKCEIQRNGIAVDLEACAVAGDTILAIAKIRGN
jgi:hypothetical protein